VEGIRRCRDGRRDDGIDIEQINSRRPVGRRFDHGDPEPLCGAPDPSSDLAAVGDEEAADFTPRRRCFWEHRLFRRRERSRLAGHCERV
jgi:hypothetical protein